MISNDPNKSLLISSDLCDIFKLFLNSLSYHLSLILQEFTMWSLQWFQVILGDFEWFLLFLVIPSDVYWCLLPSDYQGALEVLVYVISSVLYPSDLYPVIPSDS